jgi:hypothetical protein
MDSERLASVRLDLAAIPTLLPAAPFENALRAFELLWYAVVSVSS